MKRILICILLASVLVGCGKKEPVHEMSAKEKQKVEQEKDASVETINEFSTDPKDYEDVKVKGSDIIKLIETYSDQDYCIFVYTEGLQDLCKDLTEYVAVLNYNTLSITATMNGEYNTYVCMAGTDDTGRITIDDYMINEHFEHVSNNDVDNAKQHIDADKEYRASPIYLGDSDAIAGVYFREI